MQERREAQSRPPPSSSSFFCMAAREDFTSVFNMLSTDDLILLSDPSPSFAAVSAFRRDRRSTTSISSARSSWLGCMSDSGSVLLADDAARYPNASLYRDHTIRTRKTGVGAWNTGTRLFGFIGFVKTRNLIRHRPARRRVWCQAGEAGSAKEIRFLTGPSVSN